MVPVLFDIRNPRPNAGRALIGLGGLFCGVGTGSIPGGTGSTPAHLAQICCTDLQTFFLGPLNPRVAPCPKQIVDGILERETGFNPS